MKLHRLPAKMLKLSDAELRLLQAKLDLEDEDGAILDELIEDELSLRQDERMGIMP